MIRALQIRALDGAILLGDGEIIIEDGCSLDRVRELLGAHFAEHRDYGNGWGHIALTGITFGERICGQPYARFHRRRFELFDWGVERSAAQRTYTWPSWSELKEQADFLCEHLEVQLSRTFQRRINQSFSWGAVGVFDDDRDDQVRARVHYRRAEGLLAELMGPNLAATPPRG